MNDKGQLGQGSTADLGDGAGEMGDYLPSIELGTGLEIQECFDLTPTMAPTITFDPTFDPTIYVFPSYSCKSNFADDKQTCALFTDSTIKCFGWNAYGQLGLGDTSSRGNGPGEMGDYLPFVSLNGDVKSVAVGTYHSCAVFTDFSAACWGEGGNGQLG
jgi:hypothetical protein